MLFLLLLFSRSFYSLFIFFHFSFSHSLSLSSLFVQFCLCAEQRRSQWGRKRMRMRWSVGGRKKLHTQSMHITTQHTHAAWQHWRMHTQKSVEEESYPANKEASSASEPDVHSRWQLHYSCMHQAPSHPPFHCLSWLGVWELSCSSAVLLSLSYCRRNLFRTTHRKMQHRPWNISHTHSSHKHAQQKRRTLQHRKSTLPSHPLLHTASAERPSYPSPSHRHSTFFLLFTYILVLHYYGYNLYMFYYYTVPNRKEHFK